jgi:hypothetical protein
MKMMSVMIRLTNLSIRDYATTQYSTTSCKDTLAIVDCCFASTAAVKSSSDQTQAYFLLAASSTERGTPEPGPKSFTTALCNSVEELLDESGDEIFPLIKL